MVTIGCVRSEASRRFIRSIAQNRLTAVGLVAANVGGVRLIDNMEFDEGVR